MTGTLILDDRTYADNDGTWTRIHLYYGSPWANGAAPDVMVKLERFKKQCGNRFDFDHPASTQIFHLDEVNIGILSGWLAGVNALLWRQWTQYDATPKDEH